MLDEAKSFHSVISGLLLHPSTLRLLYVLASNELVKTAILGGSIIVEQRGKAGLHVRAVIFHPDLIYWRRVFESLYHIYIRQGLAQEEEAVDLLKHYISWFNGHELVGRELHARITGGKQIPVHSLGDGHRVAVFLGMLYAATSGPTVFLVNTPEAFVRPDGLAIVADIPVRLVAEGNQDITATQSIEFLEELLKSAKECGIAKETVAQQLRMSPRGRVEVFTE